ncbi:MAG: putative lipopolysaccharide heptosyltransferase III [Verrucomicrobiota bacterium]
MERILVLQLKRIGDLILTLPALSALREAKPDAHITIITADASGTLAPILPQADEVLNYHRKKNNLALWWTVLTNRYDITLDFTGTDRSILFARLSQAPLRVTFEKLASKKPWRQKVFHRLCDAKVRDHHTVDYHLALLETIGIKNPVADFQLHVPEEQTANARAILDREGVKENFVLLHPGTAREEKYWPANRWAAVADELHQSGQQVVITGADDLRERAEINAIQSRSKAPIIDLAGKLSLVELAAVIERAQLAIGVDTAAMHFAAAARTPQIVLFGPTNPFHWGPRHENAIVLLAGHEKPFNDWQPRHPEAAMEDLSTDAVTQAIYDTLIQ